MSKKLKKTDIESVDKTPTDLPFMDNPDPSGRISTAIKKDGEQVYLWDGKEVINREDGFRMLAGQESIPHGDNPRSTFSHISQEKWDAIFNSNRGKSE
jgi:hypothetical protein|tara:strand:- start:546 stop:839 length:294 start_codon:yes stop_codon:yes gene_type:complete